MAPTKSTWMHKKRVIKKTFIIFDIGGEGGIQVGEVYLTFTNEASSVRASITAISGYRPPTAGSVPKNCLFGFCF